MNIARTSANGELVDAMSADGGNYRHKGIARNNSASLGPNGRRQRPMTAKVKNSRLK